MKLSIFDSCTHPTIELLESWPSDAGSNIDSRVKKALAISLPGGDGENDNGLRYIEAAKSTNFFLPIVSIDPRISTINSQLTIYKNAGVLGVKIHPRFLCWAWTECGESDKLVNVFQVCEKLNLVVFFCTYFSSPISLMPKSDPVYLLTNILNKCQSLKIVLMHAGGHKLLDYIEMARFNKNIMLDISFSPIKFGGSSLDFDLAYAIKNFEKRLCFGSDWPYCNYSLAIEKVINIFDLAKIRSDDIADHPVWFDNLEDFLGL